MKVLPILSFFAIMLLGSAVFAQGETSFSNLISASIEKQLPVEKVYLHLDRTNSVFFTNDTRGIYQLIVEGIDDNGRLGRQLYRFRVE
ncbi:hypothetical protein A0256_03565 [Mucilaginibacter sp. PAMC 26640]|nr:hypothetical protein A0256_03565 [Mucilaginibacter sp. PAMC 26640]